MSLTFHSQSEVDTQFVCADSNGMDVALYRGDVTETGLDDAVTRAKSSPALTLEVHIPKTKVDSVRPMLEQREFKVVGHGVTHFSPRYEYVRYGLRLRGADPTAAPVHPQAERTTLVSYERDAVAAANNAMPESIRNQVLHT